jgi:hypothetical protein
VAAATASLWHVPRPLRTNVMLAALLLLLLLQHVGC